MTCIVGFTDGKTVTIGADSAGVGGLDLTVRADEKVFVKGEFVFGFTSSFRLGQLLRFKFSPPRFVEGQNVFDYMVTSFIEEVRSVLKTGGFLNSENGRESGGTFLVGIRGKLFAVHSDFQVSEGIDNFCAVGCGDQIAHGAMHALEDSGKNAESRILLALEAAERFSAGVRRPFIVRSIPNATPPPATQSPGQAVKIGA